MWESRSSTRSAVGVAGSRYRASVVEGRNPPSPGVGVDDGDALGGDAVHPAAMATAAASAVARLAHLPFRAVARLAHLPFRAVAMAQSFHPRAAPSPSSAERVVGL